MEEFDWTTTIKANLLVLRSVGLWPKNSNFYKCDPYLLYVLTLAFFFVAGFNLSQFISMFYTYSDLDSFTATILLTSTNFLALIKTFIFVKNLKTIKQLLHLVNTHHFRPKSSEEIKIVLPFLNQWKKVYHWYNLVVILNLLMWSLAPLMDTEKTHQLPFTGWFPLDTSVSPYYQLFYLYQLLCMWPMSLGNINLDCISMALMVLIKTQCDLLCHRLKNLREKKRFDENFLRCVKHHKAILWFAETSNNFFNWIILGQFATSTAVIALIMFQLSLVSPVSSEGLSHLFYINGITTQIFLYCWFGNEIQIQSRQIAFSVYESEWFGQSQSVKKNVLVFCMRCQKPINITAIKIFSLSLHTFISIMRSAYSYFALLANVREKV